MKISANHLALLTVFAAPSAFADYFCNISLYQKSDSLFSKRAIVTMTIGEKHAYTSMGDLGGSELILESKQSRIGFAGYINGWNGAEEVKLNFFRATKGKKNQPRQYATLSEVTLKGNGMKRVQIDAYELVLSCMAD